MEPGRFLVVEDEPLAARSVTRVLRQFGTVETVSSQAAARGAMRQARSWSGFVIDLCLPDGNGLEVLAEARERHPHAKAVLLSGALEHTAINGAFALDARCLSKPCRVEHLEQFAREALIAERELPDRLTRAVRDLAVDHELTPAETEILIAAVGGADRRSIVAARQVSKNTHKRQVRGMLRKTGAMTLGELRDRVLRSVASLA